MTQSQWGVVADLEGLVHTSGANSAALALRGHSETSPLDREQVDPSVASNPSLLHQRSMGCDTSVPSHEPQSVAPRLIIADAVKPIHCSETTTRRRRTADQLVLVGGAAVAVQLVVLAAASHSIGVGLVAGVSIVALGWLVRSDHLRAGVLCHTLPVAGIGGLAMLVGPGLDLARSRPLGAHAGWSLVLMLTACWFVCAPPNSDHRRSWRRVLGCRAGVSVGMVLGMAMAHTSFHGHHHLDGAGFTVAHLIMVGAMTLGSMIAMWALAWAGAKT